MIKKAIIYQTLVFGLILFSHCSKKGSLEETISFELSEKIKGTWIKSNGLESDEGIETKNESFRIMPEEKKATLSETEFELRFDALGMRVFPGDTEFPVAYFLFSELGSKIWIGTWEERVIRLFRQ